MNSNNSANKNHMLSSLMLWLKGDDDGFLILLFLPHIFLLIMQPGRIMLSFGETGFFVGLITFLPGAILMMGILVMPLVALGLFSFDRSRLFLLNLFRSIFLYIFFLLNYLFIAIYNMHFVMGEDHLKDRNIFSYDPQVIVSLNKEISTLQWPKKNIKILQPPHDLKTAHLILLDESNTIIYYKNIPSNRRPKRLEDARYLVRFSKKTSENPYAFQIEYTESFGEERKETSRIPLYGEVNQMKIFDLKEKKVFWYEKYITPKIIVGKTLDKSPLYEATDKIIKRDMEITINEMHLPFPNFEFMVWRYFVEALNGDFSNAVR